MGDRAHLRSSMNYASDFISGTVVFFVALPLCLGIALASNAPLISGVIAGIIGGVIVGAISGSHTSVSGPAAGLTAVIAAQIANLGSFESFLFALIIAGLIQILLGVSRAGFIAAFFPSSVIKGLLAAIGIILVLKQLPHLVGWDMDFNGEMAFWQPDQENTFSELSKMLFNFHPGAMLIGILSLIVLVAWDKFPRLKNIIPSPLVVVALGLLLNLLLQFFGESWAIGAEHLVKVPVATTIAGFFDFLSRPDLSQITNPSVYLAGLTIALVASLETLLNLDAVDKLDPKKRISPPNRELVAQGIGNTLLGFVGGLPVTSVVIRGSVNINSGAKTRFSTIAHGLLLAICVILFPQWINHIPLSCLAAILIMTGIKLANHHIAKQMWRQGFNQFLPFSVTVLAIVFTDLLVGVIIGLATSIVFILRSNLRRPIQLIEEQYISNKVLRVVLANQVSFLNKAAISGLFEKVPPEGHLLLDASHTDYIDSDILDLIIDYRDQVAPARNIQVSLIGFKENYALANVVNFHEHSTNELQEALTPTQVLQILKDGNERVLRGQRLHRDIGRQISATSTGQYPLGIVLSCMDSRASVELIFDLGIGDVFSARIAGHVISPKVLGSLEFACAIAGAKLILVMGHTRCGAVSAAIDYAHTDISIAEKTGCDHLGVVIEDVQKIVRRYSKDQIPKKGTVEREPFEDHIVQQNVLECMKDILDQSKTLRQLADQGAIAVIGCVYNIRNGKTEFLNQTTQPVTNARPATVQQDAGLPLIPEIISV